MKHFVTIILVTVFLTEFSVGQQLINAFSKEGHIFIQYDNGTTKQIVSEGSNSVVAISKNNNIVIYKRVEQKSKFEGQEGAESYDQLSIRSINTLTNDDVILFTTCLDGYGGTKPDYANSNIYPNKNLCGFESAMLDSKGERLYFQTSSWATSPAIHYYDLKENKLVFFKAGWLQKVTKNDIEIQITGIEMINNQGQIESKGRYTQYCLFDKNGNLIKELSAKTF